MRIPYVFIAVRNKQDMYSMSENRTWIVVNKGKVLLAPTEMPYGCRTGISGIDHLRGPGTTPAAACCTDGGWIKSLIRRTS